MNIYQRADLKFQYNWNEESANDPILSGSPDDSIFDRTNGYHLLYLLNYMYIKWTFWDNRKAFSWMENLVLKLPVKTYTQKQIEEILTQEMNDL